MAPRDFERNRFKRVAESRVERVIHTLDLLKNCSSRNNYEYTEEQVEQMFKAIENAVQETKAVFQSELKKQVRKKFTFEKIDIQI